jgi:hypothetical protein
MQLREFWIPLTKITLSLTVNHRISFAIALLMHDEMNSESSQIETLDQFHMNASCMVTLSCLRCSMKFKRRCFGIHLHGQSKSLWTSLVDLAWLMIINIMNVTNFSNLAKVKFVKVQNNLSVVCMLLRCLELQHLGLQTN